MSKAKLSGTLDPYGKELEIRNVLLKTAGRTAKKKSQEAFAKVGLGSLPISFQTTTKLVEAFDVLP